MMLELQNVTKQYGKHIVLDDVSFSIKPGERVALLGANGAGKTTTIRAICKLLEWERGTIRFHGESIMEKKGYLSCIGAVLEGRQNLNWRLSIEQNAYYFAGIRGLAAHQVRDNIKRLREQLGLDQYGNKIVSQLSSGNKQKSALLSVLAYEPELLLLDEPTLGLDLTTVDELGSIIIDQSQKFNRSFIITSHDLRFIDRVCDRVIVIKSGRIVSDSPIQDIKRHAYQFELTALLSDDEVTQVNMHKGNLFRGEHVQWSAQTDRVVMKYNEPAESLPFLAWMQQNGIAPRGLEIAPVSLEAAYKSIMA